MEELIPESKPASEKESSSLVIPAAIVLAGVLIAGAIIYSNLGSGGSPAATGLSGEKTPQKFDFASLPDDDPLLGNPAAPVTIVEFGDFQCPFCGRFFKTTEPQIIEQYVKTGKARFIYRDFAFLGLESDWAAMASECADEQGKFWQYHDYLYSHQRGENEGAFAKTNLKQFARVVGLDAARFDECVNSEKYRDEIEKDTADGRAAGVQGTPAVFIGNTLITGAVPFAEFQTAIDAALNQ